MAIPAGVYKISFGGHLATLERFVTSFWVSAPSLGPATDATATSLAVATAGVDFQAAAADLLCTSDGYDSIDVYQYTGGSAAASHGHATISRPGTGTAIHPKQIAAVLTLRTATTTRSGRGRMYLPATGLAVGGDGIFATSRIDACVDTLATWFTAMNGIPEVPVVVSQTSSTSHPVTSIDADYVPDTQRRRRSALRSARHSHSV